MHRLQQYAWPGNIRELRNVIDRARLFADDGVIGLDHLPPDTLLAGGPASPWADAALPAPPPPAAHQAPDRLRDIAAHFQGSRKDLAQQLGLSERTLYRRLKALGLAGRP